MPVITSNGRNGKMDVVNGLGGPRMRIVNVDPLIKSQLDTLNALLGKKIFPHTFDAKASNGHKDGNGGLHPDKARHSEGVTPINVLRPLGRPDLMAAVAKELSPELASGKKWKSGSLGDHFDDGKVLSEGFSLSELVDATAGLSTVKYTFHNEIQVGISLLPNSARVVLSGYPAISDYLLAFAYFQMEMVNENAIKSFILENPQGLKKILDYAIVGAARAHVVLKQINVPGYDDDKSKFIEKIQAGGLSIETAAFLPGVTSIIENTVYDRNYTELFDKKFTDTFGPLTRDETSDLVKYFKASPVKITKENVLLYAAGMLQQIRGSSQSVEPKPEDRAQSDLDFDVNFLDDNRSQVSISKSAVKCAAQLYYAMILGDELEVFNVVNYFTHKFLVRGSVTIEDSRLRENLQQYVFSNRFTDLRTNKLVDRTRPAERAMFYRQVFNYGTGQISDDIIVNQEFPRLWKMLMLESAKYLQRAQISPNPDTLVSPQNVMQAAEDLQYNLSTHCTGMANVITPLIYAELDFVIRKIFMHPEIVVQVAGRDATWWRVVETLFMGMKNERPKATVIYNKAKKGHDIIRAIAEYDSASFTQSQPFSDFIGKVEGFIISQSILQESLTNVLKNSNTGDEERSDDSQSADGEESAEENGTSGNQWDF